MWLFGDSFDHYTDLAQKYNTLGPSGQAISSGTGRYGTSSVQFTTGNGRLLKGVTAGSPTAGAFLSMALRFVPTLGGRFGFANLWDAVHNVGHVVFTDNPDGSVSAWRQTSNNGPLVSLASAVALLGTTPAGLLTPGTYHSVELYASVHASAGAVRVRVNGHEVLTLTGQNTLNPTTGGDKWTGWYVGLENSYGTLDVDDVLIYDDYNNGDGVTDFLGDLTAECLVASGVGSNNQWTRNTGATNVSCVDETPPDGDTTYVEDATVGHLDTYTIAPLARITDGIRCVQVVLTAKKTATGTRAIAGVVRRGTSNYPGPDQYLGTAYGLATAAFPTDPSTSTAWTAGGVAATEIGPRITV